MKVVVRFYNDNKVDYYKYENISRVEINNNNQLTLFIKDDIKAVFNINHILCYETY